MTVELITGQGGTAHIDSEDVGAYQAYTFGTGRYILHGCEASIIDSNTVRISAGELMVEGRHIRIIGAEDIQIQSGTIGQKRTDLIAVRYTKDGDGIETCVLAAIIGTPSAGQPSEPDYIQGSILDSDIAADFPLFRISIDGITPGNPVCMFDRAAPFSGRQTLAGVIYPYAGSAAPKGFLLCDGAEYSRTEYPELFAVIGTVYGEGDGSTTFNVPNLKRRVPVGADSSYALGDMGGEATHTLTVEEMPSHSHPGSRTITAATTQTDGYPMLGSYSANAKAQGVGLQGGDQAHNNMQPYTVTNYIIATGKDGGVNVIDIVQGAQALPLGVEYGGTGATNAIDTLVNLGVDDHIVAQGVSGIWEWRKWESGFAECCCVKNFAETCTEAWGNWYYSGKMQLDDYPFQFVDVPVFQCSTFSDMNSAVVCEDLNSATKPPSIYVVRPNAFSSSIAVTVSAKAEGRWK